MPRPRTRSPHDRPWPGARASRKNNIRSLSLSSAAPACRFRLLPRGVRTMVGNSARPSAVLPPASDAAVARLSAANASGGIRKRRSLLFPGPLPVRFAVRGTTLPDPPKSGLPCNQELLSH